MQCMKHIRFLPAICCASVQNPPVVDDAGHLHFGRSKLTVRRLRIEAERDRRQNEPFYSISVCQERKRSRGDLEGIKNGRNFGIFLALY